MPHPPASMKEIAEILGTSTVSVSLALRDSSNVSDELKARVSELVKNSGFKPRRYPQRRAAKVVRQEQSQPVYRIGILYQETHNDPVSVTILDTVTKKLAQLSIPYELVLCKSVMAAPEIVRKFDGILYYYEWKDELRPMLEGIPQVVIMNDVLTAGPFDSCKAHNELAGKLAAEYLLDRGFRDVVMIWNEPAAFQGEKHPRLVGFRNRMEQAGVEVVPASFRVGESLVDFVNVLRKQLEAPSDKIGLFAFCDQVAYQVCTILDALGRRRENGKLELVSCDHTYLLKKLVPAILSIDLHISEIASAAVDRLLYRIGHPHDSYVEMLFKPDLPESIPVEGES